MLVFVCFILTYSSIIKIEDFYVDYPHISLASTLTWKIKILEPYQILTTDTLMY